MANPGMYPVHAAEYHITDMPQQSCLLTTEDTPPHTPHLVSHLIDYCIRAKGLQIRDNMVINQSDPDYAMVVVDQLWTLADHELVDKCGRMVEIFNLLGNICLELLVESVGVGIMIRSGEPSPESSNNRLDCGETFTCGNDELD